jgi:hypothetical protein
MNFGGHVESMTQNDLPLSIYRGIKSHRACWQPNTTLVNASTMFAMEHICSPSLAAKLFIRRQNTFGGKFCLCQPPYLSGTGGLFYSEMRLTRNQLATVAGAFDAQTAIDCLEFQMVEIYWDFYFRALRSLVVLSFPQLLSFSSVLSKSLAETVTSAETAGCPTVEHL